MSDYDQDEWYDEDDDQNDSEDEEWLAYLRWLEQWSAKRAADRFGADGRNEGREYVELG